MIPFKSAIRRVINSLGFDVVRAPTAPPPSAHPQKDIYEPVFPAATYSPWNKDHEFQEVLASIKDATLVDGYRCYELWNLLKQSAKLSHGSVIEIGAWRGGTGALIAKQALNCGIKEPVFLCDTFTGVVKAGEKDSSYRGGEHSDTSRSAVEELIFSKMNLSNVEVLEGIFPDQTGHRVENLSFRFCHVDVDVYQSARDSVEFLWDRMVPGGIFIYDDYGFRGCDGITKYVEEQMASKDRIVLHNLNGHAIIIKL